MVDRLEGEGVGWGMDVVFDNGGTPRIDAKPIVRAKLVYDADARRELLTQDWRAEQLPYSVPDFLRLVDERKAGMPCSCTEALCRRMEQLVIDGTSVQNAKTLCGIGRAVFQDWKRKANRDIQPYWQFMERMKLAMAYREANLTRTYAAAAEHPDPGVALKAAGKVLEWTNPAKYAPKPPAPTSSIQIGSVNVTQTNVLGDFSPADLAKLLGVAAPMLGDVPLSATDLLAAPPRLIESDDGDE